jgi:uncharacterized protein YndB with AHSA1/START domain
MEARMPDVEREITIPAAPAEVWPAVTESDELSSWFGAEVELEAQPGGRGVFRWPDGAERHVVVEDVEPERRLAFRWLPFQRTGDGDTVPVPSTRVEIILDPVPDGTRVRVIEQPAFAFRTRASAPMMEVARRRTSRGWGPAVRGAPLKVLVEA